MGTKRRKTRNTKTKTKTKTKKRGGAFEYRKLDEESKEVIRDMMDVNSFLKNVADEDAGLYEALFEQYKSDPNRLIEEFSQREETFVLGQQIKFIRENYKGIGEEEDAEEDEGAEESFRKKYFQILM
jgi:hypothetical protein